MTTETRSELMTWVELLRLRQSLGYDELPVFDEAFTGVLETEDGRALLGRLNRAVRDALTEHENRDRRLQ